MSLIPSAMLVDTNVWLDYYLSFRAGHDVACSFIGKAVERDIAIYTTVSSTKDLFYLLGSSLKQEMRKSQGALSDADALVAQNIAWSCLEHQSALAAPIGADASDAFLARKYRSVNGDYEDNVIIAAARRASATIVTADLCLIKASPVPALSVEQALSLLSMKYLDNS